jgi:glucose uptake protein GlcU
VSDVNVKFGFSSISGNCYKQLRSLNHIFIQSVMCLAGVGGLCLIMVLGAILFSRWDLAARFLLGLALTALIIIVPILLNIVLDTLLKRVRFAKLYKKAFKGSRG